MGIKISVIIPVYNAENFIGYCLDSVLSQSYDNYEIIAVDDGSTDNTSKILDEYSTKNEKIKVLKKENGGVSSARNLAIANASGDYVLFLDSDNAIPKGALSVYADEVENNKVDIVQGFMDVLKVEDKFNYIPAKLDYRPEETKIIDIAELCTTGRYKLNVTGKLYRFDVIKKYSFPENTLDEDVFFNGLIFCDKNINSVAIVNYSTYLNIVVPTSLTHSFDAEQYFKKYKTLQDLLVYVNKHSDNDKIKLHYLAFVAERMGKYKYSIRKMGGYDKEKRRYIRNAQNKVLPKFLKAKGIPLNTRLLRAFVCLGNAYAVLICLHDPYFLKKALHGELPDLNF